jgi:hypothetical protein
MSTMATQGKTVNASLSRLGSTAKDYKRIGISPGQVAPWEDGARTDGSAGTYEWWYFDAHLDDGAKLVVVFLTKNFTDISKPLAPMIRIDLDLPDGTSYNKIARFEPEVFSASQERCHVRIGGNSFKGDLRTYKIIAKVDDIAVEVGLTGEVPARRPRTGHWYFGAKGEHEFNWLPAVPQGKVDATYSVAGKVVYCRGRGVSRPQLGQCPDEFLDQPLVLGSRAGRSLHRRRVTYHGGTEVRQRRASRFPAGQRRPGRR